MKKLFSLQALVVLSFVSNFIAACGTQPSNTNQVSLNNNKTFGIMSETHLTPTPIPIIKKTELPKPVVKKEDNKNPQIIRIELPKPTATPIKTPEPPRPIATPVKTPEPPRPIATPKAEIRK